MENENANNGNTQVSKAMADRDRVRITFIRKPPEAAEEDFGLFCVKLASLRIPFSLTADTAVLLYKPDFDKLPEELEFYLRRVDISIDLQEARSTDRKLISRDEAKQAARTYTKQRQ